MSLGTKNILVIEDDSDISQTLVILLQYEGYKAESAKDADEALERLRLKQQDLIILDTRLPKVSGFEVCRRIRQEKKYEKTPIIVISAFSGEDMRKPYLSLGVEHYFIKPFDFDVLKNTIAASLK